MWTFELKGDGEQPKGFIATMDGPVEDVVNMGALLSKRGDDLAPQARTVLLEAIKLVVGLARDTKNGKRRASVNMEGGEGTQRAWSVYVRINLAEDPEG